MKIKGIHYDVGTEFVPGDSSRELWTAVDVVRDFRVIHRELGCNSVNLYGTHLGRLVEGGEIALAEGLEEGTLSSVGGAKRRRRRGGFRRSEDPKLG